MEGNNARVIENAEGKKNSKFKVRELLPLLSHSQMMDKDLLVFQPKDKPSQIQRILFSLLKDLLEDGMMTRIQPKIKKFFLSK
jgi:hypothetical protein